MGLDIYNCRKCGMTVFSDCSKCHRIIDVKKIDDGCLVRKLKCKSCSSSPVIKDMCLINFSKKY